ncbi:MAG: hypothetical protein GY801_11850 [bacterium]|nr:hypothetical protein [bacterium]
MKKQVLHLGFQNQAGLGIVDRPMIIVITPFIDNKASYRLYNLQKNQKNDKVNLAEPYWYTNTHYDVLCFMYGSKAEKRPDILDVDDLHSILEYLDDHYHYTELVHVPYDIHLKVDAIYNIITKGLFLNYHQLTEKYLEKPFIKYKHNYYQIPVSFVDADDSVYTQTTDPLIQFKEDNLTQEINTYLSHLKFPQEKVTDRILAMPIGGWCGVAEALKFLGLREEAYPFDYIRSDLTLIVNLLEVDSLSRKHISEILFSKYPDAKIEFVHHNVENDSTRETFITRTVRFIERIKDSKRPILFIRAANSALDLYTEIQQSRRLLRVVETHFHRKGDKLLLIANYQEIPTGKMTKLHDGQIIIWNAMGVNAWRVPNNWHLVTNLIKIIAHELHYFHHNSEINYKMPPDYKEKPVINNTLATEKSKALTKNKTSTLLVHLIGQEPLEFSCDERSPILKTLFKALYDTENNSRKKGVLIHLQIQEDGNPQDIFLRSSQMSRLEVTPPLDIEVLRSLNSTSNYLFLWCLRKASTLIKKILALSYCFIHALQRRPNSLLSRCLRKVKSIIKKVRW